MKIRSFAALALACLLGACSKTDTPPGLPTDRGCSEIMVVPVTQHDISAAEAVTANTLFARNSIDNRSFRYTRYSRETVQTYFPPYATFTSQLVSIEEYIAGLRVFTGHSNFLFKDGVFNYRAGRPTGGTSLDPKPALLPEQLRGLFSATTAEYDPGRVNLQGRCVTLELGYYDVNTGIGNAPELLVKAWKVSVKNTRYPFAYYQDQDGKLIYYDNGIRTFR